MDEYTQNFQERDRLLFGHAIDWEHRQYPPGVCERFEGLDAMGIETLLEMGFMHLQQTMNATPTVQHFLEFARSMQAQGYRFQFEGYTFDPRNADCKTVVLEGIYYDSDYPAEVGLAFARFVAPYHPDELALEERNLRAWWD